MATDYAMRGCRELHPNNQLDNPNSTNEMDTLFEQGGLPSMQLAARGVRLMDCLTQCPVGTE